MAVLEFDADIECSQCGSSLDFDQQGPGGTIVVDPCDACYQDAFEDGQEACSHVAGIQSRPKE
jgi:hypothetical protein